MRGPVRPHGGVLRGCGALNVLPEAEPTGLCSKVIRDGTTTEAAPGVSRLRVAGPGRPDAHMGRSQAVQSLLSQQSHAERRVKFTELEASPFRRAYGSIGLS